MTTLRDAGQAVERIRGAVTGQVLEPGDDGYDDARRVWNGMIDRRPVAIVRAATVGDIAPTIRARSRSRRAAGGAWRRPQRGRATAPSTAGSSSISGA